MALSRPLLATAAANYQQLMNNPGLAPLGPFLQAYRSPIGAFFLTKPEIVGYWKNPTKSVFGQANCESSNKRSLVSAPTLPQLDRGIFVPDRSLVCDGLCGAQLTNAMLTATACPMMLPSLVERKSPNQALVAHTSHLVWGATNRLD
jgi:hypothetical protein